MSYVLLRGGLGNQLFQVAAAIWASHSVATVLVTPSQVQHKQLDSLSLPNSIHKVNLHTPHYKERYLNAALSISGAGDKAINGAKRVILKRIIPVFFPEFHYVSIMSDLGYCSWLPRSESEIAIGYFQTYRYVEEDRVKLTLMKLRADSNSMEFKKFLKFAKNKEILVVHIRRGDYRKELKFGLLSKNYYRRAIEIAIQRRAYDEIWFFSDEPLCYEGLIPNEFFGKIRIPEQSGVRDIGELFDLMRLGSGYVIANSSFSWWAATLSNREGSEVFAPKPWFAHRDSPRELISKKWTELEADFGVD
jgi:hypothetical protein